MRELRAALEREKPLVLVFDPDKGGAPLPRVKEECPLDLVEKVFEGRRVHEWHRVKEFQLISLKQITEQMLLGLPNFRSETEVPLYVPDELTRLRLYFQTPVRLYVSRYNPGAPRLALELGKAVPAISATEDLAEATHVLLYLTSETFVGEPGERLAALVRDANARAIPVLLVHEKDPQACACEFAVFFETTPNDLIMGGIYSRIAVAFYPPPFREVSTQLVALGLGAIELTGLWTSFFRLVTCKASEASIRRAELTTQPSKKEQLTVMRAKYSGLKLADSLREASKEESGSPSTSKPKRQANSKRQAKKTMVQTAIDVTLASP